ncbi:MAG: Ku protein [Hyphomicrobiales bacterium]
MRAYWKGHLRLSLVTIAVELHAATASPSSTLQLHQLERKSGKRIRYLKTTAGGGAVKTEDIVKGFELKTGKYVVLTPEELEKLKLETKHTIELVQFAAECDIDPRYFERPYYLVPADDVAAEGYAVIRDALKAAGKTGVGQMTMRGRENLVAVRPCGDGLLLETLRYPNELRKSDKVFADIPHAKASKEMVDLAKELIERKSGKFDPAAFKDHYGDALRALVEEKRKKGKIIGSDEDEEAAKSEDRGNVVDLMEALRRSVKGKAATAPAKKPARKVPAKRRAKA